ncbi:MAG: N-acetylmuramoyl-L-alanine amidase [Luteimonas sp.]|nr:N-acetylmuramoyl-L-alanine amidase [Luteimonas sp.]
MSAVMKKFLEVGQSTTSPAENTERKEIEVEVYVGENGYVQNAGFTHQPIAALEETAIQGPNAIVMHRTVSSTASSALSSFKRGIGTHFLIDKDGTTYQTASLKYHTSHIGPIRSRCFVEGTCPAEETKKIAKYGPKQGHDHEKNKAYPDRYPVNKDSVGIEVVAMYDESTRTWDEPTAAQTESIKTLVRILKNAYRLEDADLYAHDTISRKTEGEGKGLYSGD